MQQFPFKLSKLQLENLSSDSFSLHRTPERTTWTHTGRKFSCLSSIYPPIPVVRPIHIVPTNDSVQLQGKQLFKSFDFCRDSEKVAVFSNNNWTTSRRLNSRHNID